MDNKKNILDSITNFFQSYKVGDWVKEIREQLSMRVEQLSQRSGLSVDVLKSFERGDSLPSHEQQIALCRALQCDLICLPIPKKHLDEMYREKALELAKKHVEYVEGTMSLEDQLPSNDFCLQLIEESFQRILNKKGPEVWDEI